jgi:tetratricopeptide (TPR) repeat protein
LLTYRSDEVHTVLTNWLAQQDRERRAQEFSLARLTRNDVDAMLAAIFELHPATRSALLNTLYPLTEGNPFFVEEVLTSLRAAGGIFYAEGAWRSKALEHIRIPRSVQAAVQQRSARLSEAARELLTLAAVAGRHFDVDLLLSITQQSEEQLLPLLKELMAAQLVVEESGEHFAFRHALTRQAIYADLLVRERKALHRRIAQTMERLYGSSLDAHLADLAYHFYEAGAWEQAVAYGQRAGEQALRLYAPHAAVEQLTRALDAAQHGALPPSAGLYRLRGQAYEMLGDFEQARLDDETTLRLARLACDRHAEWQATLDLGFLWLQRDYTQTGTYYQQALELARHLDDPIILARTLNRLGNWHVNVEQPHEALRYHQEALTLFEQAQDQHGIAQTCDLLGMTTSIGGDLVQATAYYQQAIALFRELDDQQGLASSLTTLMLLGEGGWNDGAGSEQFRRVPPLWRTGSADRTQDWSALCRSLCPPCLGTIPGSTRRVCSGVGDGASQSCALRAD